MPDIELTELQQKFVDCVRDVNDKNKGSKTRTNPFAVCRKSVGYKGPTKGLFQSSKKPHRVKKKKSRKYDLPEPLDIHFEANDIVLRLVPEIDNLFELALYISPKDLAYLKDKMDSLGIEYDKVSSGYLARRGRKQKATNVFIIES